MTDDPAVAGPDETDRCPECGCVADVVLDIDAVGSGGPVAHDGRVCIDHVGGYGSDCDSVWRLYCHRRAQR